MKTLISIDPGKSSGIAVGTYSDTEPYKRTHAFQIEGGLVGFKKNFRRSEGEDWSGFYSTTVWVGDRNTFDTYREEQFICPHWDSDDDCECPYSHNVAETTIICEKFTPRQALTLDSVEPLRIEGYLVGTGVMPDYVQGKPNTLWNQPIQQYFSGGYDLKSRKKAAYDFLRKHDLYLTGKQVGCKDAHDAMSATLHAISWLRRQHHEPTLRAYWPDETED